MQLQASAVGRALRAPALLSLVAIIVQLSPAAVGLLEYDRARIAAGELWRLLTCQWSHCSTSHLVLDVLVLTIAGGIYQLRGGRRFTACMVSAAIAIPVGLWLLVPEMASYRGLSGVDVAAVALLAVSILRERFKDGWSLGALLPALVIAGIIAKITYEMASGQGAFVDTTAQGFVPVPLAHVLGGIIGAAVELFPKSAGPRFLLPSPTPAHEWAGQRSEG
jgi:rhomboid family GlyGly-CTERM serine protease